MERKEALELLMKILSEAPDNRVHINTVEGRFYDEENPPRMSALEVVLLAQSRRMVDYDSKTGIVSFLKEKGK